MLAIFERDAPSLDFLRIVIESGLRSKLDLDLQTDVGKMVSVNGINAEEVVADQKAITTSGSYRSVANGEWFTETSTMWPGQGLSLLVDEILFQGRSLFQVKDWIKVFSIIIQILLYAKNPMIPDFAGELK